jgi:adenylate cyclase
MNFAEKLAHRPSKAFALFLASYIHECRGEWMMTQRRAQAAIGISRELELANWPTWSSIMLGRALTEQGKTREGIALILESLAELRLMGSEISRAHFLALLAEALHKDGRTEEAISAIHEAMEASDRSKERYYEPELHRLKGELLLAQFDSNGASNDNDYMSEAHDCFERAIQIARRQAAKSLELRAVMSQAKLLHREGKSAEAHASLRDVYDWFTEGFETSDLKSAKNLLAELQTVAASEPQKTNYSSA